MAKTSSKPALLRVAMQDIHAGKRLLAQHLPAIAARIGDRELHAILTADADRAAQQAERFGQEGFDTDGPPNLWMNGILDDAARDTRDHVAGDVLDIALVGAIRKAKAAEIVSLETAIALARQAGHDAAEAMLAADHQADMATDAALARRLAALTDTR